MQEMDVLAVNLGGVLWKLVECGLILAPVVASAPILSQVLEVFDWNASAPASARQLVGPTCVGQTVMQIVQVGLGNRYFERLDTHVFFAPCVYILLFLCRHTVSTNFQMYCFVKVHLRVLRQGNLKGSTTATQP